MQAHEPAGQIPSGGSRSANSICGRHIYCVNACGNCISCGQFKIDLSCSETEAVFCRSNSSAQVGGSILQFYLGDIGGRPVPSVGGRGKMRSREVVNLSNRERECLQFVSNGWRPAQIAHHLSISKPTVDFHLKGARVKLQARSIGHAVAQAIRHKQISL